MNDLNTRPEKASLETTFTPAMPADSATLKDTESGKLTPAMAQYVEIKKSYMEYLIFYRMGDFYELFFEDAVVASSALGLALTSRSKLEDKDIPMCGVPFHAYEMYLARLIKQGYKVAICEQMEDPKECKKRGAAAIIKRDIIRLVTPGTLTEDSLLDPKRNNFIASVCVRNTEVGIAWIDISTGAFFTEKLTVNTTAAYQTVSAGLAKIALGEVLFEDKLLEQPDFYELFREYKEKLAMRPHALYNLESTTHTLLNAFKVQSLEIFGDLSKTEILASGILLDYIQNTQKGKLPKLSLPERINSDKFMEIDAATRRNLELLAPLSQGGMSLLKVMDKTVTGVGGRMLAERLTAPIMNIEAINNRLDAVQFFVDNPLVRKELRTVLRQCSDMERAVQRLSLGRAGPKDLYDLASSLRMLPDIRSAVLSFAHYQPDSVYPEPPAALKNLVLGIFDHTSLAEKIAQTLLERREDLPLLARTGGFVREGVHPPLDYMRNIRKESENRCEELRREYINETGVSMLKIKSNSLIGYFVEVPSKAADVLFENKKFIHRQSVLNAVRFTTLELSELENEVNNSEERANALEMEIYEELTTLALAQTEQIRKTAEAIGALDVATALAELAAEYNYVRPVINDGLDFEIEEGRHPVVEAVMQKDHAESFVGNSCNLSDKGDRMWLLTGPNMAGKSTFLRQNALIAIMAQMGAFVPAKKATIGIIDKIFSRVGASDDLARGRSTFMVEMVETSAILNRADARSFVILDEIGRGTATFDGLSIAWAVAEHLYEVNHCRTLFATHYHELTELNKRLPGLSLHSMKIKEYNGEVIFMHEVQNGAADRSYGIHVAELAGLPKLAIARANQVLKVIEQEKRNKALTNVEDELPLFEVLKKEQTPPKEHPALLALKTLDVDSLSPREALDKLYELHALAKK